MSGEDLLSELGGKVELLDKALKRLGIRGRAFADAERNYRVALNRKILAERDKGVPVTIISDVCRGDSEVADFRFERDTAEALYRSAMEAINVYKLQIKVLENMIEREYRG